MVHIPAAWAVTVVPDTVHTGRVSERSDTGSCEVARADSTTGLPTTVGGGCLNLMVCGLVPAWTAEEARHVRGGRVGSVAALGGRDDAGCRRPGSGPLSRLPCTRPRWPEWKDTGRPEEAVARSGTVTPAAAPPGWVNVMVWVAFTRNDRVTCVAAAVVLPSWVAVMTHRRPGW